MGATTPPNGGGPATAALRALLGAVAQATDHLAAVLDAAGLNRQLRDAPAYSLRQLDRALPNYSVGDLLLVCEAYATVTAPSALATGDLTQVREEARRTLHLVQAVASASRGRRRLTMTDTIIKSAQATFLRTAFNEPPVHNALVQLIDSLSAVVALEEDEPKKRARLLPIGTGCFVPVTVLGGAVLLIVFLLTSIALATGQVSVSGEGVRIPAISGSHGGRPDASQHPPTVPPVATRTPRPTPTATPRPVAPPTATIPTGPPTLTVSKTSVFPCPDKSDGFTLTYTNGQQPITWVATWPDQPDITLTPASGTLQPGSTPVPVTVTANTSTYNSDAITITPSGGLSPLTVQYDSNKC